MTSRASKTAAANSRASWDSKVGRAGGTTGIFTYTLPLGMMYTGMHTLGRAQVAGGIFIWEVGLIVMAGTELMEWYQTHQIHGFYVF